MKNDIRGAIINYLEKYCKERDVQFVWAQEKRIDGVLTVNFKKNGNSYTHRFTHIDIDNMSSVNGTTAIGRAVAPVLKEIDGLVKRT